MSLRTPKQAAVAFLLPPMLFCSALGWAETSGRMAQLRKIYQSCVIDAVASNVRHGGADLNPSLATEMAFQACNTEEQAILADAYAAGVSPVQANQVITGYKLSLKQTIRKTLAEIDTSAPQPSAAAASLPPQTSRCGYRRYDGAWIALSCD
jgi:hypothetical protein